MVSAKIDFRRVFLISLCLIIVIIVPYWQVISFDFVGYDDQEYVTENSKVQKGLTVEGLKWAFTTFHSANWHPITWLSHMLDCELYGLNPTGHHWTNVEFHIANTLLLFFILQYMTRSIWRSALVAALFALHPLHVESVAWVAERKDVLSTFFLLLTILAYLRYIEKQVLIRYFMILLFFILGLMSKPMLVTLPFVLLLLDFWPLKRFQFKNDLQSDRVTFFGFQGFLRLFLEKILLVIPVVISCSLTFLAQKNSEAVKPLESLPLIDRISNALVSYVTYALKTIWPNNLAIFYPHPGNTLPAWQIIGAALLIAVAIFLSIHTLKKYPYIIVGLFWYLGTLVPVIGLVQVGDQAMADRYTYIPLIGLFIIVAWGVSELLAKWYYRKIFLGVCAMIILAALTASTFFQASHWRNAITLFENATKVTKNNYQAQNNLGAASYPVDLDKAIFHFKKALKIKPDYVVAHYNLGTALCDKKNYDKAVLHLKEAIKINPECADAHYNLAYVISSQGKLDEAVLHYKEAIRINPEYAKAHYYLGKILMNQKKVKEAIFHFAETIRISPDYADAYSNLGIAYGSKGYYDEGIEYFQKAIVAVIKHYAPEYPINDSFYYHYRWVFVTTYCGIFTG